MPIDWESADNRSRTLKSWSSTWPPALLVLVLCGLGACARLQEVPELPESHAVPPNDTATLDRLLAPEEARRPAQSAFRLVHDGHEAFGLRVRTADLAERSLDVQTYIWRADVTGRYLAARILAAADRGVRVRLLLDDMDARAKNAGFAAFHAHPMVEIRLFNPFSSRDGTLALLREAVGSFARINRRMHNKTWIVDNRVALTGGRNLGDEYFGASELVNFVDLDFLAFGPVVRDMSASFDLYWNSALAYPMDVLDPAAVGADQLAALRNALQAAEAAAMRSEYAATLRDSAALQRIVDGQVSVEWASAYRFVADDPLKAATQPNPSLSQVLETLVPVLRAAQRQITIVSPYFVPADAGTRFLVDQAQHKTVRILTNSLVANDVAAVHGGYARYRRRLLEGGVLLWEMKPQGGGQPAASLSGSSGASLHTKALAVDGTTVFVGSYNLDPRSTSLNCEQGVLVAHAALAEQFEHLFAQQTAAERAWSVTVADGRMTWTDREHTFHRDPQASAWRRLQAWLARVLRLDAQL